MRPSLLTVLLPGVFALAACSRPSSSIPDASVHWTLKAPNRVIASPAAQARFTVEVSGAERPVALSIDGLPVGVLARVDPPEVSDRALVTLSVAEGLAPATAQLTVRGNVEGTEQKHPTQLDIVGAPKAPTHVPEITVALDQLFYAPGAAVNVTVDFGSLTPPPSVTVFLSSTDALDVERLVLERAEGSTFRSVGPLSTVALSSTDHAAPNDGALQLHKGDCFHALYFVDSTQFPNLESGLVSDFAFLDGPARPETPTRVDPALRMTSDEASAARPIATLLRRNALPLQLAANEVVATPEDQGELDRIVALTQGRIVDQQPVGLSQAKIAYLLQVPTDRVGPERLSMMRHFLGERGELASSRAEGLGVYGLVLLGRLEGPRWRYVGVPPKRRRGKSLRTERTCTVDVPLADGSRHLAGSGRSARLRLRTQRGLPHRSRWWVPRM